MSDHDPNTAPNGNTSTVPPSAHHHAECTGCGETSHILLPLADLLKAVASTLQAHPSHPMSAPPSLPDLTPNGNGTSDNNGIKPFAVSPLSQVFRSVFDKHSPTSIFPAAKEKNGASEKETTKSETNQI